MRVAGDDRVERLAAGGAMGIALLLDRLAAEGGDFPGDGGPEAGGEPAGGPAARAGAGPRLGQPAGMAAAGGRRAGLPAGDEAEGLEAPMCLQTAPLTSKSGHVQAGLLALLDGDLVDGGALRRLLAQRPERP